MKDPAHLIGKTLQHSARDFSLADIPEEAAERDKGRGEWRELLEGRVIWLITIKLFPLFSLIKIMQKM